MIAIVKLPRIAAVALAVLSFVAVAVARTQEKSPGAAAQTQPAPAPGPEMDRLKFLRGYWKYAATFERNSAHPTGGKGSGSYITTEGPAGFSQITEFSGTNPEGRESGHEVVTWDPQEQVYKSYVFGASFPGCVIRTGHWDGNTLIFDADFVVGGSKIHSQAALTASPDGTVTIVEKSAVNDGALQPTVTIKATREKI